MNEQQSGPTDQFASQYPYQVLVGEDDPVSQALVEHLLKLLGYQVCVVPDGDQVLDRLDRGNFNLVFLDINMPGRNGLKTAHAIRRKWEHTNRSIAIIAMTASTITEDVQACYDVGMNSHITKPIDQQQIKDAISSLGSPKTIRDSNDIDRSEQAMTAALDDEVMQDLILEIGDGLADIIITFLEDTPLQMTNLERAVEERNYAEVQRIAHLLKSSSGIFGAGRMTKICLEIEQAAKENIQVKDEALAELGWEYKKIETDLNRYIQSN